MTAAILDTNAISDLMRDQSQLRANVARHTDRIVTSVVVIGEIRYGLDRLTPGKKRDELEARARTILVGLAIEPISQRIADTYGSLKASLEQQGLRLGDNDLWIAATALTLNGILVTRDRIFSHIPGLQVADWSV